MFHISQAYQKGTQFIKMKYPTSPQQKVERNPKKAIGAKMINYHRDRIVFVSRRKEK